MFSTLSPLEVRRNRRAIVVDDLPLELLEARAAADLALGRHVGAELEALEAVGLG